MDTTEFLRFVLPRSGVYFAATPLKRGFKHHAFNTPDAVAAQTLTWSAAEKNAYFACAAFAQAKYVDDFGKKHYRTAENAVSARAQWLDIDCGNAEYPTQAHAVKDLKRFLQTTGLRRPNLIVSSGFGLHLYWVFEQDVPKTAWVRVAAVFKAICAATNFAQTDTSRTADIASVLRPIGTVNDKTAKGRGKSPVRLLAEPVTALWDFRAWATELASIKKELRIELAKPTLPKVVRNTDLTAGTEYPAAYAERIAEKCAMLRDMRDTLGAEQQEPLWYQALGVLAYCEDGESKATHWSSAHPGYDADEVMRKLAQRKAAAGPSTCANLSLLCELCAGCEHQSRITSPIVLGRIGVEHQTTDVIVTEEGERVEVLPELPPQIAKRFAWNNGVLFGQVDDEWMPICGQYPVVEYAFWCTTDAAWKYRVRAWVRTGIWRSADIQAKNVASGGTALLGEMGAKLGVCPRGAGGMLVDYMRTWAEIVQANANDMEMHDHFGWYPDGSFLCGARKYLPNGEVKEVRLAEAMAQHGRGLAIKGDLDRYCALIGTAYNRPKHQAYQCSWLAAFGAPLLRLLTRSPIGVPLVAWSKETGFGKTTAALAALGVWGDPASDGQYITAGKTTEYALLVTAGLRRDLPVVLDETTLWKPEQLAKFAYDYSDGRPKSQGRASGGLRDNSGIEWANFILVSANASAVDSMSNTIINSAPMIARVWEYEFTCTHEETMSMREGARVFDELKTHYGLAGDAFLRYIVPRAEEIRTQMFAVRDRLEALASVHKDARNWVLAATTLWTAFHITAKLGLHHFSQSEFRAWLIDHLRGMSVAAERSMRSVEELFSDLMNEIQPGLIVTINEGDRRGSIEAVFADKYGPPRGAITGRVVLEQKTVYVSQTLVRKWCAKHAIPLEKFKDELKAKGWLKEVSRMYSVAKGTAVAVPPMLTMVFDIAAFEQRFSVVRGGLADTLEQKEC